MLRWLIVAELVRLSHLLHHPTDLNTSQEHRPVGHDGALSKGRAVDHAPA